MTIFTLIEELYESAEFVGSDVLRQADTRLRIQSQTFPELELTAEQI
ncbi:MAG: hypothetical protein KME40_14360 [Komarekiella atlantica HA4396-MV6]|nr:hypothetical protein [Komarekiella atlantica HA4396-MV6]